ncbi:MAG: NAD(+) synthase [Roseburia sp.]|nr:NAD(+) synthase [Roseburia sp.]
MKYGIVKVAAATPKIKLNDPKRNAEAIAAKLSELAGQGVEIAVFPELCLSGYTAADLFYTTELLDGVAAAVEAVAKATPKNMIAFFGAPIAVDGRLYNCAVAASDGKLLGIVPKTELPDYGEFYEKRYFTPNFGKARINARFGAPMGDVLFRCATHNGLVIGCEICEDMWADVPPSVHACRAGATVIVNLSVSDEVVGKAEYRRLLIASASGRQRCAYIYADAGEGESSTDAVYSAHNIIAENGAVIAESEPFCAGVAITDIDVERLDADRRRMGLRPSEKEYVEVPFSLGGGISLSREISRYPFVPSAEEADGRAELILSMQARGLKTRFDAINAKTAVIGVSGGLDSALALVVACRAVDKSAVKAVTMPCFGTTEKTRSNAEKLCAALGVELQTIDLKDTVNSHFKDIEHTATDVVYENAQARMRTLTLFDIANKTGGLVVGTGDLSELALGWATYNGDHMSSYGVNAGVPKTLVKYLVRYEAKRLGGAAKAALEQILGTEISPELLPPEKGAIAQKTEDILGKYDLHDFIMYYHCRFGFTREKIGFLLRAAFPEVKQAEIDGAIKVFYKRFFANQFKRSCLPDGVKIGSVSFSPRSDFRMPSDAADIGE